MTIGRGECLGEVGEPEYQRAARLAREERSCCAGMVGFAAGGLQLREGIQKAPSLRRTGRRREGFEPFVSVRHDAAGPVPAPPGCGQDTGLDCLD